MKLIIDRTKWLRGEGASVSYLLREQDQKMCCLGFYSIGCGLKPSEIKNVQAPEFRSEYEWLFELFDLRIEDFSQDCYLLMKTNDQDCGIDEEARERIITEVFAKHGVEVEFIN